MVDLRATDLNLLVSLDVLLAERNVTRAAERLHISQPALSAQLGRLRQIFDDPLLMPAEAGRGMTPTARWLELLEPLRAALLHLHTVIQRRPVFDPTTDERTFQLVATDNSTLVYGLPLIERFNRLGYKGIRLAFRTPDQQLLPSQMEGGEVDIMIGAPNLIPSNLKVKALRQLHYVVVQRKGHPRGTAALTLDSYCELEHLLVSNSGGSFHGFIDDRLEALGRRRRVALSVHHFTLVPEILRRTDYVSVLSLPCAERFADTLDIFALPFDEPVAFPACLAWHPRNHHDPGHLWLREQITELVREPVSEL